MSTACLRPIESLPTSTPSRLKGKWREVVREVNDQGAVAIKAGSAVEMVLVSAETYSQLVKLFSRAALPEGPDLDELSKHFKERLLRLQEPQAGRRLSGVLASKGRAKRATVAGRRR